ncbi:MAG: ferrous iron transporter B [Oscillospiraceae bacterium]|nr:ferrous iron transporter B [Oscillospiraceae bacterium]
MCMGIGCGAVGITGARIIDSPRERLIAIITNSFMPCNGRLPAIIALITMFFTDFSVLGAAILTGTVVFSVLTSLLVSKILGRAVLVAVPAGIIIWLCSYFSFGGKTVLEISASALDPFARLFGLDGNVLCGFVLSFPANEIALPIMAMGYSGGLLSELGSLSETAALFSENGFTSVTALCSIIFFLFHWPCATTVFTIWKETKSFKWTFASVAVPLLTGLSLCFAVNMIAKLFLD